MAVYSLASLIDAACFISGVDGVNRDVVAESLIPIVFQNVTLAAAKDPEKRSLVLQTHTITLTNGVGTIPDEVLTSQKFDATVVDPDDDTIGPLMSLILEWKDFIDPTNDVRLGYWTIKNGRELHWINPNENYSSTDGKDGEIELTIVTTPTQPATASSLIDADEEIQSDLLNSLVQAIKAAGPNVTKVAA
jgi:hypothetical protein